MRRINSDIAFTASDLALEDVRATADHVKVVRNAARELTHSLHFLRLSKLGFKLFAPFAFLFYLRECFLERKVCAAKLGDLRLPVANIRPPEKPRAEECDIAPAVVAVTAQRASLPRLRRRRFSSSSISATTPRASSVRCLFIRSSRRRLSPDSDADTLPSALALPGF
jgi:hypothetical protein